MTRGRWGRAWIVLPLLTAGAAVGSWLPIDDPPFVSSAFPVPVRTAAALAPDTIRELGARAAARNPFRLGRRPSAVRFDPSGNYPPPPPPPPPKPTLALAGIVLGEEPSVIIEGLPGRETGVVLKRGEEFGGVTFDLIRADSAVLRGYDTVWVLGTRGGDR